IQAQHVRLGFGGPAHVRRPHGPAVLNLLVSVRKGIPDQQIIGPIYIGETQFKPSASCAVTVEETFGPVVADDYAVGFDVFGKLTPLFVIVVGVGEESGSLGCKSILWIPVLPTEVGLQGVEGTVGDRGR